MHGKTNIALCYLYNNWNIFRCQDKIQINVRTEFRTFYMMLLKRGRKMQEADRMAIAQNQRDLFVPNYPPGRWEWCQKCGAWSPPGDCPRCLKREERLQMLQPYLGKYLEIWLEGLKDRTGFLLEGYQARRDRLLREGDLRGLLAMEQAEEEFVDQIAREKKTGTGYHGPALSCQHSFAKKF